MLQQKINLPDSWEIFVRKAFANLLPFQVWAKTVALILKMEANPSEKDPFATFVTDYPSPFRFVGFRRQKASAFLISVLILFHCPVTSAPRFPLASRHSPFCTPVFQIGPDPSLLPLLTTYKSLLSRQFPPLCHQRLRHISPQFPSTWTLRHPRRLYPFPVSTKCSLVCRWPPSLPTTPIDTCPQSTCCRRTRKIRQNVAPRWVQFEMSPSCYSYVVRARQSPSHRLSPHRRRGGLVIQTPRSPVILRPILHIHARRPLRAVNE